MRCIIRTIAPALLTALVACSGTCSSGEGPTDQTCRFDPRCAAGAPGAFCRAHGECTTGFCCSGDHCAGGTCTYPCRGHLDCPADMGCEHGTCLFWCAIDADCGPGQSCRHDDSVCEYDH